MLFDLGLNHKHLDNQTLVRKKIEEIEADFDLVMIAEFFYESLILLRHELCWDLQDVTSFTLNARIKSDKDKMKERTRELLTNYLKHDYMLYNHFKKIFIKSLSSFGYTRLEKEIEQLAELDEKNFKKCSLEPRPNGFLSGDQKWYGPSNLLSYSVHSEQEECISMTMSGLKLIDRIRRKQTKKAEKILRERF